MFALRCAVAASAVTASRRLVAKAAVAGPARLAAMPSASAALTGRRLFSQTVRLFENEGEGEPAPADQVSEATEIGSGLSPLNNSNAVFVRNMVFDVNEAHLKDAFQQYGEVEQAVIPRDARGLPRGYGFVYFKDRTSVDTAIQQANGSFWHGRRLQVQERSARTEPTRPAVEGPTDSLYIGNIPYETTDTELNRLFGTISGLNDVRVAVDRNTGWPRGFAHADFDSVESATAAKDLLVSKDIGGRILRVDFAQSRADFRKRVLQAGGPLAGGFSGGSRST